MFLGSASEGFHKSIANCQLILMDGKSLTAPPYTIPTGDELKLEDQVKSILSKHGMVLDPWNN
jgi:hypothetical protein